MDNAVLMWNAGQFIGFLILIKYMLVQLRDTKKSLEEHMKISYNKEDVEKIIDLKLKPIDVVLTHVQKDITEIKSMLGKLLDARN